MHKPLGDLDRLAKALEVEWGWKDLKFDPHLPATVQETLRKGNWEVTAIIHQDEETARPTLIGLYPGLLNEAFGIACDIGSTTIALHLVSILSGLTIASAGAPNPQIRYGRRPDEPGLLCDDEPGRP